MKKSILEGEEEWTYPRPANEPAGFEFTEDGVVLAKIKYEVALIANPGEAGFEAECTTTEREELEDVDS